MNINYAGYFRVSTEKQGIRGLGMAAQREAVHSFLRNANAKLIAEFAEVESGKQADNRPELQKALDFCRKNNTTLLIAKLDRLSRNASFLLNLQESGVKFVAVDMPHADNFTVGILALVAQKEREMISSRTKNSLLALKKSGKRLGNPNPEIASKIAVERNQELADAFAEKMGEIIKEIREAGITSLAGIAHCLNVRGFKTRNGNEFKAQTVKNLVQRYCSYAELLIKGTL
jgi:DNA invertase Pin-like site-specific DNA recombinase